LICKLQGGRQDHYSATFGGLNFIDFGPGEETRVNPLKVSETVTSELESKLLLFFMGTSRKSMKIIKEQSDAIKSGDLEKIAAMHNLKGEALLAKNALLKSDLNQLYDCLNRSWEQKKRLSSNVSNTDINLIMEAARKAGALAGKVSGAGGGGFAMFFVPLESRQRVVNALKPFGGSTSSCSFSAKGVESWVY
jgi:D-glycero-alpha-D-manno-heptose-7-phosphate kinase